MAVIKTGIGTPSREDIDLAAELLFLLRDVFEDRVLPDPGGDHARDTQFDDRRYEHTYELYRRIEEIYTRIPSALLRVILGMAAIHDNGLIDQDAVALTLKFDEKNKEVRV